MHEFDAEIAATYSYHYDIRKCFATIPNNCALTHLFGKITYAVKYLPDICYDIFSIYN
jgi:hypothetical protein